MRKSILMFIAAALFSAGSHPRGGGSLRRVLEGLQRVHLGLRPQHAAPASRNMPGEMHLDPFQMLDQAGGDVPIDDMKPRPGKFPVIDRPPKSDSSTFEPAASWIRHWVGGGRGPSATGRRSAAGRAPSAPPSSSAEQRHADNREAYPSPAGAFPVLSPPAGNFLNCTTATQGVTHEDHCPLDHCHAVRRHLRARCRGACSPARSRRPRPTSTAAVAASTAAIISRTSRRRIPGRSGRKIPGRSGLCRGRRRSRRCPSGRTWWFLAITACRRPPRPAEAGSR